MRVRALPSVLPSAVCVVAEVHKDAPDAALRRSVGVDLVTASVYEGVHGTGDVKRCLRDGLNRIAISVEVFGCISRRAVGRAHAARLAQQQ